MKKVTISGGADGRTVTISGGNGASQTFTTPKPVIVQTYAYPNLTVGADPELEQRVSDLETDLSNIELTPGPQGVAGADGAKGDKGDQGIQGIQGVPGNDGADYASTLFENVVLSVANWTLVSGFYEYNYENSSITATSLVNIIPYKDTIDFVKAADIMPMVVSGVGTVKIYAQNEPVGDITVAIELI